VRTIQVVLDFCENLKVTSEIILSSFEYVHATHGSLKNEIDEVLSRRDNVLLMREFILRLVNATEATPKDAH
jgi:hypothetical protein